MGPRSRSMRPPGGGVRGGVMVAMGGMGSILMLSSASAPSRVPHVVCSRAVSLIVAYWRWVRGFQDLPPWRLCSRTVWSNCGNNQTGSRRGWSGRRPDCGADAGSAWRFLQKSSARQTGPRGRSAARAWRALPYRRRLHSSQLQIAQSRRKRTTGSRGGTPTG